MIIAALFTIAGIWKPSRCQLADEWIRKYWYIYQWNITDQCAFKYTAALARKKIKPVGAVKTEN